MSRKNYPPSKKGASPLIVVLGPTASGKSELAIKLAKKFGGEIVSADSRQIYQEMNVGTGKITKKQTAGIPHHLINIVKPDQEFTLAQYKKLAIKTIKDIQKRNKLPFLVGGTGLYIQAVVDNLAIPQVKPNKKLRDELEKLTNQELLNQLGKIDPFAASAIDPHNKRRLVRALEVCLLTKKPFSGQRKKGRPLFNVLPIGLKLDKKTLHKKINRRVEKMIKMGLIEETKKLAKKYSFNWPAMSGIGYQEIGQYLRGDSLRRLADGENLERVAELIKLHTRQYARRQMTWFKKDKRIKWAKNYSQAEKLIRNFLL